MSSVLCVILNWRTAEMSLKAAQAAMVAMEGIDGAITLVDNDSQDGSFEAMVAASRDWVLYICTAESSRLRPRPR